MNNDVKDIVCNNCGEYSIKFICTRDYNRGINDCVFTYNKCVACGLISLVNVPENLDKYYAQEYYEIPTNEKLRKVALKNTYQIEMVKDYVSNGRLLDVGSAFGTFAYIAKEHGFDVHCIEMDDRCCNYLRDTVGVKVFKGNKPEQIIMKEDLFDVVTFWHNIEHLVDPWTVLEEASRKIRRDGIMLIATPNPDAFSLRTLGRFWPHVDAPRHINIIPRTVLNNRLNKLGLSLEFESTNDKGGRSWNRFSWQRLLMNRVDGRNLQRIAFVMGYVISIVMYPFDTRKSEGSAYTAIYRKRADD